MSHLKLDQCVHSAVTGPLSAAGEIADDSVFCCFLNWKDAKMPLKHICREAIRNHLLKLDPHQNLFGRIPKLGLPSALTSYLLYNLSLEVDAIAMKTALKALFNEEVLYHSE